MHKVNIGLIGYGTVGSGVAQLLKRREEFIRDKFDIEFVLKSVCDRSIHKKDTRGLKNVILTKNFQKILNDPQIHIVVELIGGLRPAKDIILGAFRKGKHVVTANKELIANYGKELFQAAKKCHCHLYFESSVCAGVPIIKNITEGMAGNKFSSIYGIINGTCNFILTEMTKNNLTFGKALEEAQKRGFAEANPTLDIKGWDSTHKLAILVYLCFGKFIDVQDIYTEGITSISHHDIEHAESLNLTIKLLAIAKKADKKIDARVHPTLISNDHPLASVNGVANAVYLNARPLGDLLFSGEGAGQMSAASGVVSDLINFASRGQNGDLLCNLFSEAPNVKIQKIDEIKTKFYIRFMATDKPGVLSKISGILARHNISINSVTQKAHVRKSTVPVIMLTDYTTEKMLRLALNKIYMLPIVKSRPVAIRMENL